MSDLELDDVAARALASIILERTADALAEGDQGTGDIVVRLAEDTGLVLDVCAAILFATSWLAGVGQLPTEDIFAGSLAMQPDDDETVGDDGPQAEGNARGGPESASSPTSYTILPLVDDDQGAPCVHCTCPAIGYVDTRAVCFHHIDHDGDNDPCPVCGQTALQLPDPEAAP